MASALARIAFTPNVRALQSSMGSREAYRRAETGEAEIAELGPMEVAFIRERDSFYQASVGENGWPYVQHRGGPAGFLKVLDGRTLGYADYSGNRQYISAGNLAGDERVCLFLMDYARQLRLKIWGRARMVDESLEPTLFAQLESAHFRARAERGILITVEAFDWNCPKYITPRYTEAELRERIAAAAVPARDEADNVIGEGALTLAVTGIRQLTSRVRAYELRREDRGELPQAEAGAHLVVPVRLPDGSIAARQYSVASDPARRGRYEIAVLREEEGRGGSRAIHDTWRIGTRIRVDGPVNHFPLHDDARPTVLIAGGIGITPLKAMAHVLASRGAPFELHYAARTPAEMAYGEELSAEFPQRLSSHFTRVAGGAAMDVARLLAQAPPDGMIYVCGPVGLIRSVLAAAQARGIPAERVQYESFV